MNKLSLLAQQVMLDITTIATMKTDQWGNLYEQEVVA